MKAVIVKKEWAEYRRDGRFLLLAALIAGLLVLVSATSLATQATRLEAVSQAQTSDGEVFEALGERTPHGAAHFGRMAYKPVPAMASFDPGASAYLGQVIWLEAHTRGPAMFRKAEDASDIRRLADLSLAGVLRTLLPLLVFLLGYGAFAMERERGTLRQLLCTRVNLANLYFGKVFAITSLAMFVLALTLTVTATLAMALGHAPGGVLYRSGLLMLGYGFYILGFTALSLWASAKCKRAKGAVFGLLGVWAVSVVLLPGLAAGLANHLYPTPDGATFWAAASGQIRENRPKRDSEAFREVQRQILSRMLGREVDAEDVAGLEINSRGVNLEIVEVLDARAYAKVYGDLHRTYKNQHRFRQILALLSPTIALQHFSSAVAGTDVSEHMRFAEQAERQRQRIVSRLNEDMALNGVGKGFSYVAGPDFWRTVPEFAFDPTGVGVAFKAASLDLAILLVWCLAALWLGWRGAIRQQIL